EATVGDNDPYDSCMSSHGVELDKSEDDGYAGLLEYLDQQRPTYRQIPFLDSASDTDAWTTFVDLSDHAFDADEQCRADGHARAMALLQPQLEQFHDDNANALKAVASEWDAIVDEATANGWSPASQPLDP